LELGPGLRRGDGERNFERRAHCAKALSPGDLGRVPAIMRGGLGASVIERAVAHSQRGEAICSADDVQARRPAGCAVGFLGQQPRGVGMSAAQAQHNRKPRGAGPLSPVTIEPPVSDRNHRLFMASGVFSLRKRRQSPLRPSDRRFRCQQTLEKICGLNLPK
jgi:hypothetical protein